MPIGSARAGRGGGLRGGRVRGRLVAARLRPGLVPLQLQVAAALRPPLPCGRLASACSGSFLSHCFCRRSFLTPIAGAARARASAHKHVYTQTSTHSHTHTLTLTHTHTHTHNALGQQLGGVRGGLLRVRPRLRRRRLREPGHHTPIEPGDDGERRGGKGREAATTARKGESRDFKRRGGKRRREKRGEVATTARAWPPHHKTPASLSIYISTYLPTYLPTYLTNYFLPSSLSPFLPPSLPPSLPTPTSPHPTATPSPGFRGA